MNSVKIRGKAASQASLRGMLLSGGAAGSNAWVCGLSQQLQGTCGVWNKHPKPSCSKMDARLPAAGAKCPFLACSSAISAVF